MIDWLIGALQLVFALIMTGLLGLFVLFLLLAWSWAQHRSLDKASESPTFTEILTLAAVEWGALLTLISFHGRTLQSFVEASRFDEKDKEKGIPSTQLPVVLIPSLLWSASLYRLLFYRLKAHYFKSIWTFSFKTFLQEEELLRNQLEEFLLKIVKKTETQKIFLISFGSSRPLISRLLDSENLKQIEFIWIAVSAPQHLPAPFKLLRWKSIMRVYNSDLPQPRHPDVLLVGERDSLCYPSEVFGNCGEIVHVPDVGHFGCLLHSTTVHRILETLESQRVRDQKRLLRSQ